MTKLMPMIGMVVSGLVGILFIADLAVKVPFRRVSMMLDIGFLLAAVIVAYLMMIVVMFTSINLVVDFVYTLLDPRVRLETKE